MRFRSSITKALLVALAVSLFPVSAESAQKITPGSNCKVANQKIVYQGKTYTCIKSGKKLIWNKGVAVKKTTATATATATATPTPTPTPEVADTNFYAWSFRFNESGVLERKQSSTGIWTTSPARKGQVIHPIRAKAFELIKHYQESNVRKAVAVKFHFSSNVQASVVQAFTKYFEDSVDFFSSRIPDGSTLDVLIATEKDDSYRREKLQRLFSDQSEANEFLNRSSGMFHQFNIPNPLSASGGGSLSGTSTRGKYLFMGAVCSCFSSENLLMYNVAHEVTHFYQFAVTPSVPKQNFTGVYPNLTEGKIFAPSSLFEGSANTLGSALNVKYVGWYSDLMDWHLGRYKSSGGVRSISSVDEVIRLMYVTKSWLASPGGYGDLNYPIGQLQYEYFIATYGVAAYFELFDNIQKLGDFDAAILKTISKSEADFFKESAPYVLAGFNGLSS
jgi:hypothetical protein